MTMDVFTDYGLDIFGDATKIIRKSADQIVNNSETLVDDNELLFAVGANEVWAVEAVLKTLSATTTPDVKTQWDGPTGVEMRGQCVYRTAAGAQGTSDLEIYPLTIEATDVGRITFWGRMIFVIAATAGNIKLQWAQNVATAEDTKILANSFIIAHRLA